MTRLGYSIKIIRQARGFSAANLAAKAGISGTYLSLIESGDRIPPQNTLEQIAASLRVDVRLLESFLTDSDSARKGRIQQLYASVSKLAAAEKELRERLGV